MREHPSLTDSTRLAEQLSLAEPDQLCQDALEITVLRSPPFLRALEELVVPLLQLGQRLDVLGIGRERLRFEDEASSRSEAVEASSEKGEEARVEALKMDPLCYGETAGWRATQDPAPVN